MLEHLSKLVLQTEIFKIANPLKYQGKRQDQRQ
jgi:hypothetical protein